MSTLRALTMPKWGIEMTEGTLAEWSVKEGERVTKGQTIAQIETDKIVNELQAEANTLFVRLTATPGTVYEVGAMLAVTADEPVPSAQIDEFVRTFRSAAAAAAPSPPTGPAPATLPGSPAPPIASAVTPASAHISAAAAALARRLQLDLATIHGSGRHGRITLQDVEQASRPARTVGGGAAVDITPRSAALDAHFSSPLAKRLALEHRVDLSALEGTGPRGRISRADVARAAGVSVALRPAPAAFEVSRLSATRKAIARQLTLSKSTIPHFYLRTQLNLDALSALRTESKRSTGTTPSLNDYFIRACALALMQVPDVNIQVHGDAIHRFRDADIAVAVAADRGLITPIIRAAQTKSVHVLAEELRSLAERARAGRLHAGEIDGGSFTVSNLGMFGIDQFDAIINPPQGAILAIGSASARPIEHGGGLRIATTAHLSLSCDHRAIDGAVGARFLVTLRELLEAPARL